MPLARIFLSVLVLGAFLDMLPFVCASVMRSPFTHNSKNGNVPVEKIFFLASPCRGKVPNSKLSKNDFFFAFQFEEVLPRKVPSFRPQVRGFSDPSN